MLDERIMLFGSSVGERMEPVCVVMHSVLHGPAAHAVGNRVSDPTADGSLVLYGFEKLVVHFFRKIFEHPLAVEHQFSIVFLWTLFRNSYRGGLAIERFGHHFEPQ